MYALVVFPIDYVKILQPVAICTIIFVTVTTQAPPEFTHNNRARLNRYPKQNIGHHSVVQNRTVQFKTVARKLNV